MFFLLALRDKIQKGELLPIQVQLAAFLGCQEAVELSLPALKLKRHWIQKIVNIHKGLPKDIQCVLRSSTRSPEYAVPPLLFCSWALNFAKSTLSVYESIVPNDKRLRDAISFIELLISERGRRGEKLSSITKDANDCVKTAIDYSQEAGMIPKRFMKGVRYPAEAAAYSIRELGISAEVLWLWKWRSDVSYWQIADCVAAHAGHSVNWASYINKDILQEHNLQRQALIELLLSWNSEGWNEDYYSFFRSNNR